MSEFSLAARGEARVSYAPAGAWAEVPPFEDRGRPTGVQVDQGRCFWLSDTQVDLTGSQQVWLTRSICEVVTPDGLKDTAALDLTFDPGFEALVIHHVRVIRDGVTREVDPMRGLQVMRREPDIDRAMYDGRLTAHYVIPDVRVGDVVDTAYSLCGAHPVVGERFAAEWSFSWSCFVGETSVRLRAPRNRPMVLQGWNAPPAPVISEQGEVMEWRWSARDTAPVPGEAGVPTFIRCRQAVRASEPMTWAEVAETFRDFYATGAPLSEALEQEVLAIEAVAASPSERAIRALRLVQSALRYQAVSIGEGGFVPRPVEQIWASRSGDCKDASRLLVTLLRALGLTADPALVNTWRGWELPDETPSLTAFNHCIVRLQIGERSYWLDPTEWPQGGRLEKVRQSSLGWALPLAPGATLVQMAEPPLVDTTTTFEAYELGPNPDSPAILRVETCYRGWRADSVRRELQSGAASLSRRYVEYYERFYGETAELAPLEIEDDLEENELRIVERYSFARPFEIGAKPNLVQFATIDGLFDGHLNTARSGGRRWPIDLGLPRRLSVETTVKLPYAIAVDGWDQVMDGPGMRATSKFTGQNEGKTVKLARTLEIRTQFLPPSDADAYFDFREEAGRHAGAMASLEVRNGRFVSPQAASWSGLTPWTVIFILVVGSFILNRCTG